MRNNNSVKSFVFFSQAGCLLPLLIIFNLLFGWFFLRPAHWLLLEAILILLFILNAFIFTKKILSVSAKHGNIIDTEGEVIREETENKQKRIGLTNKP